MQPTTLTNNSQSFSPAPPITSLSINITHNRARLETHDKVTFTALAEPKTAKGEFYIFDFGDTKPIETTDSSLQHVYTNSSSFVVRIQGEAWCQDQLVTGMTKVTVYKPVVKISWITLITPPVVFPNTAILSIVIGSGTEFRCLWRLGDNQYSSTDSATQGLLHNLQHRYRNPGTYNLSVICENWESNVLTSAKVYVEIPITKLNVIKLPPQKYRQMFQIEWSIKSGCNVEFLATFAGNQLKTNKSVDEQRGMAFVTRRDHVGLGTYDVTVSAKNHVSQPLKRTINVRIEAEVAPFTVVVANSDSSFEIGGTVFVTLSPADVPNNAEPTYHIDFGDNSTLLITKAVLVDHTYVKNGTFVIKVVGFNNVSSFTTYLDIQIHKPVLFLKDISVSTLPTEPLSVAKIQVNISTGSDFVCKTDLGDGHLSVVDMRHSHSFHGLANKSIEDFTDINFYIYHRYKDVGAYIVNITCKNHKSFVQDVVKIVIQEKIEGFSLIPIPPKIFGTSFKIMWNISRGTNVSYNAVFGSMKKLQVYSKKHFAFVVITPMYYSREGIFRFSVTVANKVSPSVEHSHDVVIQKAIYGLAVQKSLSDNFAINETFYVLATLKQGTNVTFTFDFDDGYSLTTKQSNISHYYKFFSKFKVKITAFNLVSVVTVRTEINVLKPLLPLVKGNIKVSPTKLLEETKVTIYIANDTEIACHCKWGDGNSTTIDFSDSKFNIFLQNRDTNGGRRFHFTYIYKNIGIFHMCAFCFNNLSQLVLCKSVIIQEAITGFALHSVKPQISGSHFQVRWSILSSTNVTYTVIFDGLQFPYELVSSTPSDEKNYLEAL